MNYLVCNPNGSKVIFPSKPVRTVHYYDNGNPFWGSNFLFNNQEVIILTTDIPCVDCNITWNSDPVELPNEYSFEDLMKYGETGIEVFCYDLI